MRPHALVSAVLIALGVSSSAWAVPKSLFVQPGSIPYGMNGEDAWISRTYFDHVCTAHKTPGADDYIYDLVLSEVADDSGNLFDAQLDLVDDYFSCFNNIFFGTVALPWSGAGSPYVEGMKDEAFRWANINMSAAVADKIIARYPNVTINWYVSYEANLSAFASDATLTADYAAFLGELSNELYAKRPGAVLWSPAFWSHPASENLTALRTELSTVFPVAPHLTWLHFQDFVGQSAHYTPPDTYHYDFTCQDALQHYDVLKAAAPNLASLAVNMELFVSGDSNAPTALYSGQQSEQQAREQCYAAAGVPIGASWEIRWWYLSDHGQPDGSCNKPEVCNGLDDDCDLLVDEDGVCNGGAGGGAGATGAGGASVSVGSGTPTGGSGGAIAATGEGDSAVGGSCDCGTQWRPNPSSGVGVLAAALALLARGARRRFYTPES
jgi:hypothetical protein